MRRSSEISALNVREARAWKVIDYCLGNNKGVPAKVRLAAAEFVLKRIYPEKHILNGPGENGEFKLTIEISDENKIASEAGNRISQYVEI